MKNTVKRMLSGIVAMTMVMGSTLSVNADTITVLDDESLSTGLTTESKDEFPIIEVELPTVTTNYNDKVQLNPYNLGGKGQIYTGDFKIVNHSEIPIAVTFVGARVKDVAEGVDVVSKITDQTAKQITVNISYTDSTGKAVSKPLAKEVTDGEGNVSGGTDIVVANPMTPLGGDITFTYTGSTTVSPDDGWTDEDTFSIFTAYKFTPQTFASYNITKTLALYSTDSTEVEIGDKLPTTVLGDSKIEVPVVWVDADGAEATIAAAGKTYTAKIDDQAYAVGDGQARGDGSLKNSQIYTVASTVNVPTIKVASAG